MHNAPRYAVVFSRNVDPTVHSKFFDGMTYGVLALADRLCAVWGEHCDPGFDDAWPRVVELAADGFWRPVKRAPAPVVDAWEAGARVLGMTVEEYKALDAAAPF
jgi:hypothetical protein